MSSVSQLLFLLWCLRNSHGPKSNYYNSVFSATCIPSVYETPPAALVLDAFKDGKISEVRRNILSDPLSAPLPSDSVNRVTLTPLQVSHILKTLLDMLGMQTDRSMQLQCHILWRSFTCWEMLNSSLSLQVGGTEQSS